MGRKESKLIPFLVDALYKNKYTNLVFEDEACGYFSLTLPRKSKHLLKEPQMILKGWFAVKRRPYKYGKSYTDGRQLIEAALRKSDFLDFVRKEKNDKKVYKILTEIEVIEKKLLKAMAKHAAKMEIFSDSELNTPPASPLVPLSPLSPGSSGYGSGNDFSEPASPVQSDNVFLHGLNHDHVYIVNPECLLEEMEDGQREHLDGTMPDSNQLFNVVANVEVPIENMQEEGQLLNISTGEYPVVSRYEDGQEEFSIVAIEHAMNNIELNMVQNQEDIEQLFDMVANRECSVGSVLEGNQLFNMVANVEVSVENLQDGLQILNIADSEYPVIHLQEEQLLIAGDEHADNITQDKRQPINKDDKQQNRTEVLYNGECIDVRKETSVFENLQPYSGENAIGIDHTLPIGQWDFRATYSTGFKNPFGELSLTSPPQNIFADEDNIEDVLKLNPTIGSLVPGSEYKKLMDEAFDCHRNVVGRSVDGNLPAVVPSNVNISSYKTTILKFYEKVNVQELPGMVILTCEPKMKEVCVQADLADKQPNEPRFIFDEETMKLVSKYSFMEIQKIPMNDYVMVFFKCDGAILESLPSY